MLISHKEAKATRAYHALKFAASKPKMPLLAESGEISSMSTLKKFISEHGLLLIFVLLFLVFLIGEAFFGAAAYNDARAAHGFVQVSYWRYVCTGNFLQGMFANWQAAILQLGALIIFGVFLRERGAAHSLKPGRAAKKSRRTASGKRADWFYRNSLSLAFVLLFLVTFVLHVLSGTSAYNEQLALLHRPPLSVIAFFVSPKFWFSTLQTWEAEFMAIALYIFLTIFLRQEGSPESKPVAAKDSDTGKTNE
jgi:hypothetical protein